MVKSEGKKFCVYDAEGKKLGSYDTEDEANAADPEKKKGKKGVYKAVSRTRGAISQLVKSLNESASRLDFAATMQHPDAWNVALKQLGLAPKQKEEPNEEAAGVGI